MNEAIRHEMGRPVSEELRRRSLRKSLAAMRIAIYISVIEVAQTQLSHIAKDNDVAVCSQVESAHQL